MSRRKKIILWLSGIAIFGIAFLVIVCKLIVAWDTNEKTYDSANQIPHNRVGLLLATSPITPRGRIISTLIIESKQLMNCIKLVRLITS